MVGVPGRREHTSSCCEAYRRLRRMPNVDTPNARTASDAGSGTAATPANPAKSWGGMGRLLLHLPGEGGVDGGVVVAVDLARHS